MNILGISAYYHDSSACLVQDGNILAAAQEERFTRKRHDQDFPRHAIEFCLKKAGLKADGLDIVVFYDKPFLKFDRILHTYLAYAPYGLNSFLKAMPMWVKQKVWMKDLIEKELKFKKDILFTSHHISHAASAFFPSPFDEAAVLTMDGVGEWQTGVIAAAHGNKINIIKSMDFPHSLGLLYSAFTYYCGFKVNSGEYKLMGLAPYGEPKFKQLILDKLVDIKEDGSFQLDLEYFDYCAGLKMVNKKFERLLGAPVRMREAKLTRHYMDVACSIQSVTEDIVLRQADHAHEITGKDNLCLAGGVALNCVANGRLLKESRFKNIWIQPASGDAGGALGAALAVWYGYLGNERRADDVHDAMHGSYLGPEFTDDDIEKQLKADGAVYKQLNEDELIDTVSRLINDKKVIGWFQGRMEFGPRALGNRSILGDARDKDMQSVMNLKIKFRESFRPFAPAVLKERAGDYFAIDKESPYMLITARAKENCLPAVTHVDKSVRIQTVDYCENPRFYKLIKRFDELFGCAAVINTSFNVRGEPIVCTPRDAYLCFMRTNIDYLLIGDFFLKKEEQKPLVKDRDWRKEFELD